MPTGHPGRVFSLQEVHRRYRLRHLEKVKEAQKKWRDAHPLADRKAANPEPFRQARKRYRASHKEQVRAYGLVCYRRNVEKQRRRRSLAKLKNRAKYTEYQTARNAAKKMAMPRWVNRLDLRAIYETCAHTTQQTGVVHHVDHIVPLKSMVVCGLHVPWNLRIIPAPENMSKKNRFVVQVGTS